MRRATSGRSGYRCDGIGVARACQHGRDASHVLRSACDGGLLAPIAVLARRVQRRLRRPAARRRLACRPFEHAVGGAVGRPDAAECETGRVDSAPAMTFPAQAGIAAHHSHGRRRRHGHHASTPTASFQIDFGPMNPATATFESGGQQGVMSATFQRCRQGHRGRSTPSGTAMAVVRRTSPPPRPLVTLTLGDTVPPGLRQHAAADINAERMLDGQQVGVLHRSPTAARPITLDDDHPVPGRHRRPITAASTGVTPRGRHARGR